MPILKNTPNRTSKTAAPLLLSFTLLALIGPLGHSTPARADEPRADSQPGQAQGASASEAKQWVWLRSQGCWGFGYQRNDGLWVIDAGTKRLPAAAPVAVEAPVQVAVPVPVPAPAASGDPYGFTSWLNATRASYGLAPVGVDPSLSSWASANNAQQQSRGIGHYVMGPARRQNSAMGSYSSIGSMWMASPAHRAALLDPSIRMIGIAGLGAYWTFNAR